MPCSEATEIIEAAVDSENRLERYRYVKLTCGRGIGEEALLLDELSGRDLDEILRLNVDAFAEDFLRRRHLMALQDVLAVLTGRADCGPDKACSVARIDCNEGVTTIRARLNVNVAMDQVAPCNVCASCAGGGGGA